MNINYNTPSQLKPTYLTLPGSKSITNRALLIAALANGTSHLEGLLFSDDTEAFLAALTALQIPLQIDKATQRCIVTGGNGIFPARAANIWCHDAGTTLRFLLAACAAMPGQYHFDGSTQLKKRPLKTLVHLLKNQGADFSFPHTLDTLPLTVSNNTTLKGGHLEIPPAESSQFLSGLLMLAPYATTPLHIYSTETKSTPYIEMTCNMMVAFGGEVIKTSPHDYLVSQQHYRGRHYVIEPDLSTASYFFAAAALMQQEITIQGTHLAHTIQGDIAFLKILQLMGCEIRDTPQGIKLSSTKQLHGVNVSMRDCSDTFMTLACLAPFADAPTTITDIGHTRFKECDRMAAVKENLERLGVKVVEPDNNSLTIFPNVPKAATLKSFGDHRIVMAFALIGLKISGITMESSECVTKTCPEFFTLWNQMF